MASSTVPNPKLVLEPNVPQLIALKFPTGKIVTSNFGDGQQVFFSLVDGRSAYLSLGVAQSITNLMLGNREPFNICKRWNGSKQQAPRYDVWLTPEGERERAGQIEPPPIVAEDPPSEIEHQLAASIAAIQARNRGENLINQRPPAPGPVRVGTGAIATPAPSQPAAQPPSRQTAPPTNGNGSTRSPLADDAIALVDAFATVLDYSLTTYQGRVKPEDVRSLLVTVFIGRQKAGGHA